MLYNKLDETAEGVFIISATPFKESGALDKESTKKLIDFYIEKQMIPQFPFQLFYSYLVIKDFFF